MAKAERHGIDGQQSYSALMRMALSGEIVLDFSQPLSPASQVKVGPV
jgi:hypothetical protein